MAPLILNNVKSVVFYLGFWDKNKDNWKRENQDGGQRPEASMKAEMGFYN